MRPFNLVLLPGLDGTGIFLQPLLAALPASIRPLVVVYPARGPNRYTDFLPIIREAVAPLSEFHVLGWSFSGPLALMLACAEPQRVRSVILSASFARPPRPELARASLLMGTTAMWLWRASRRVPLWLLKPRDDPFRQAKMQTWRELSARVLAKRMREVMRVDVREELRSCPHPVMYLAASRDSVVPRRCLDEILRVRPSVDVSTIEGEHFAMYFNPAAAARAIASFLTAIAVSSAVAAEVKLIGSPGVRGTVSELVPQFEKQTGHKIVAEFAVIAVIKRRIEAGEAFDVVIPGPELIDELVKQGKVAVDAHGPFGRTGVGLAVRQGAAKPDISTAQNLRRALLAAKAVGHSREGQSGVGFRAAIEKLGITEEMRPKLRAFDEGSYAAALQSGEIDMVASGMGPVLEMKGVDVLGPLPAEVQSYVRFSIGVGTAAKDPAAAHALMRFLTSPAATPVFKARGLERDSPIGR